ncbi:MAG: hypothetical protein BWZ06_01960 [Bacteroidetes bacterium ADurb.BinA261]|nr:MAG: hypothetical protein BWZ06_01960 [Bacteroidetes bacterium ADurb.BinA261]
MDGNLLFSKASLIHIDVLGSTLPIDKYSAIPSTIHRGRLLIE